MKTQVIQVRHPINPCAFDEPGSALREGQVVAFPTETVYGLGASALLPEAVLSIFRLKGRPSDNPLIVHLASKDEVHQAAIQIPPVFHVLYEAFSPGPVTYVMLRNKDTIPDEVCRLSTVAVRFPSQVAARALIKAAGVPIVAPSANFSGKPSPTRAAHVLQDFDGKIPYIIDDGPCEVGVESTVLDILSDPIRILRPGFVTAEMIYERTGLRAVSWHEEPKGNEQDCPLSPGMKYRHYAPSARVFIVMPRTGETLDKTFADTFGARPFEKRGVFTSEHTWRALVERIGQDMEGLFLSYTYDGERDIKSATRCLFDALRTFDDQNVDTIYAEGFAEPAAAGYMDRLRRAASGSNNEEPVDPPRQILFICTGNTCRSPMAEVLFNHRNVKGWKAVSAGLAAYPGMSISPRSAEALREWGIDVDAHRSQSVDDDLMEATDLIVTMTDAHRDILVRLYPERKDDIFSYSAFTEDQRDVDDPYGFSIDSYRATRDRIQKGLERLLAELERRS
ncbi:MAG: threonylcarbamoyl-AMP synthase [Clostridiaceae bacterium]|jgi:L-threonylcarbamoyladenylate synthase|nr:threonylcarbamoyl-AMP synthase [Clostridiaceae bacterium]